LSQPVRRSRKKHQGRELCFLSLRDTGWGNRWYPAGFEALKVGSLALSAAKVFIEKVAILLICLSSFLHLNNSLTPLSASSARRQTVIRPELAFIIVSWILVIGTRLRLSLTGTS
jgi:hypothetical protein